MLAHRLRLWANIKSTFVPRLGLVGKTTVDGHSNEHPGVPWADTDQPDTRLIVETTTTRSGEIKSNILETDFDMNNVIL